MLRISALAAGTIFLVARVWDAISVVTDPLVSQFTSQSTGYLWASILFSGVAWILFLLCFKMTAIVKKHKSPINAKIGFKDIGKIIIGNRQLLIVTMVSLIGNIAVFIHESAAIYYGTWNMGNKALLPLFLGIIVVSMVIANLIIPPAAKVLDKKGAYIVGSIICVASSIVFHCIPYDTLMLILVVASIGSFGMAAISTMGWSMIADTIEYGQRNTGLRSRRGER